ncbi:MAG: patatin-like phospholipase family protein [Bacteroidota bacterium]|nr:patatin-like phospholipase family protein [Bacteroidota bacterium]
MKHVANTIAWTIAAAVAAWSTVARGDGGRTIVLDDYSLPRPRWVLVLSGGGARGLAQIGVLRVLEQERLYPAAVVGTSIGAVIGALWCAGYSADEIDSIVRRVEWQDLFRIGDERSREELFLDQKVEYDRTVFSVRMQDFQPLIPEAISSGQRLELLLAELLWRAPIACNSSFDRLRIPFRAVATDLVRGETVVLRQGDLVTAVRASSTFPLRYTPIRQDSAVLVDGGLLANIPVEVAYAEFHPDFVVAVNTTAPLQPRSALDKPWNVADQVVTLMMQRLNAAATRAAWLTITPSLEDHATLDFSRFEWLVAQGEIACRAVVTRLQAELERQQQRAIGHLGSSLTRRMATSVAALPTPSDLLFGEYGSTAALVEMVERYGAVICRLDSSGEIAEIMPSPERKIAAVAGPSEQWAASLNALVGCSYSRALADSLTHALQRRLRQEGLAAARVRITFDSIQHLLHVVLDSGRLRAVELVGNCSATDLVVQRELRTPIGEPIRTAALLESWERLLATDLFSHVLLSVRYIDDQSDAVALRVQVRERGSQLLRIGGRIDNERNVQPTAELADLNLLSSGIRATARIGGGGRNSIGMLRLDVPRILDSYWTASIEGYWDSRNIYLYRLIDNLPPARYERVRIGERIEQHLGIRASVGSNVETLGKVVVTLRYEGQRGFRLGDYVQSRRFAPLLALGWSTTLDNEDRADFPSRGSYLRLAIERTILDAPGWLQFFKTEAMLRMTHTLARHHAVRWSVRFGIAANTLPLPEAFNLGGEDLFYGMREEEERGRQLALGQLEYRLRSPIELVFPTYLSLRYDIGAVWQIVQAVKFDNLKHGVGLMLAFDTPIGPARFSLGRAFYFRGALHELTLGPLLGYFSIGMRIQ